MTAPVYGCMAPGEEENVNQIHELREKIAADIQTQEQAIDAAGSRLELLLRLRDDIKAADAALKRARQFVAASHGEQSGTQAVNVTSAQNNGQGEILVSHGEQSGTQAVKGGGTKWNTSGQDEGTSLPPLGPPRTKLEAKRRALLRADLSPREQWMAEAVIRGMTTGELEQTSGWPEHVVRHMLASARAATNLTEHFGYPGGSVGLWSRTPAREPEPGSQVGCLYCECVTVRRNIGLHMTGCKARPTDVAPGTLPGVIDCHPLGIAEAFLARVRALTTYGWTRADVADALGVSPSQLDELATQGPIAGVATLPLWTALWALEGQAPTGLEHRGSAEHQRAHVVVHEGDSGPTPAPIDEPKRRQRGR